MSSYNYKPLYILTSIALGELYFGAETSFVKKINTFQKLNHLFQKRHLWQITCCHARKWKKMCVITL